jgi:hypothetical protein
MGSRGCQFLRAMRCLGALIVLVLELRGRAAARLYSTRSEICGHAMELTHPSCERQVLVGLRAFVGCSCWSLKSKHGGVNLFGKL